MLDVYRLGCGVVIKPREGGTKEGEEKKWMRKKSKVDWRSVWNLFVHSLQGFP